jgi:hypothetical protein
VFLDSSGMVVSRKSSSNPQVPIKIQQKTLSFVGTLL